MKSLNLFFVFLFISAISLAQSSILFEGFDSNSNNWPLRSDSDVRLAIQGGDYEFNHKRSKGSWFTSISKKIDVAKNFYITASLQKVSGVQNYGYGLIFGRKNNDNESTFIISGDGSFKIYSEKDGKTTTIKDWTKSSHIKKGNGSYNYLKIEKKGSKIEYSINSKLVYTSYNTDVFFGDYIGFTIHNRQEIAIKYLSMRYTGSTTTKKNTNNTSSSILFEGFDNNNNNWSEKNTADIELDITGGAYILNHKRDSRGWSSTINKYIDTSRDYYITASFKKLSGVQNNGFGFVYGRKDNDNQNRFFISADGSYVISYTENGQKSYIKNWTASEHIKKGNNQYNYLKVEKKGSKMNYYINDKLVHSTYTKKSFGNNVGFVIYDRQKISISYFSMRYTDGKKTTTTVTNNNHTTKESILFDGYTDNKNSWAEVNDDKVELDIRNGDYHFNHKRAQRGWTSTINKYIDTSRDFKILIDVKKESGVQDKGYGLIFARKDGDNENMFFINGNGNYSVLKKEDGNFNYLKRDIFSSAIRKGNKSYNVLKVVKNGTKLEYYINNTKVYTDYSPKFFGDRVGYVVYGKQEMSVAYISMGYLDKKSNVVVNNNTNVVDNVSPETYNNSGYHISEQFTNNNSYWSTQSNNDQKLEVKSGKYYIAGLTSGHTVRTVKSKYIDTSKDFEIEAKLDKISGAENYAYGMIWGGKGDSFFRYTITSNYYKVSKIVNNSETLLIKWTKTDKVNSGNQKSNKIKVKKEGDYYKFYINGTYMNQVDYEPFFGSDLGFRSYDIQKFAVDYVRVKYLSGNNNTYVSNSTLKLPLTDSFTSNTNNWFLEDVDNYSASITSGKLVIDRKKSGGVFVNKHVDIDTSKDFVIESSFTHQKKDAMGYYGLTFGRKTGGNEYSFLLSPNGNYKYRKFENDKYSEAIPNTFSNHIKTGYYSTNKVKVVKSGNLLRFYINDQYVNEANFEPFFGDKFGYTVYHSQKVGIDNLSIKYQTSSYNAPPVVVITEPNVDLKRGFKIVKTKRITVRGKATDKDGIFEVMINGVDATLKEDGSFTASVPLKVGSNDLVVKATDIKQASSTKTFTIRRNSPDPVVNPDVVVNVDKKQNLKTVGKNYALIIGVSDYSVSAIPDLEGLPTRDAQDLANLLMTNYGYKKEHLVLLNDSPKHDDIIIEFVKLRKKVTPKDNVLIFYAGHGEYDKSLETGRWLPSDANPEFDLKVISNSTILDYIRTINSKHTLLISDACYGGSIFSPKSRTISKDAPKFVQQLYDLPSRRAITTGALKTVPNESVFFKYLIKSLKNNQNKYLTARKLFNQLFEPVGNNSDNTPQYGPIFKVGDEGGDFIFVKNQ